ncbi:MAG TPA: GNAT family N-acetyltransferase [Polyangiaceae bacterium]
MTSPRFEAFVPAARTLAGLGRRHLRLGLWGLVTFLSFGVLLEAFHGFKVTSYLGVEFEARRLSFRLAHAHGTLLSLLNVVFALLVVSRLAPSFPRARRASGFLTGATLLLPGGFLLGGVFVHGGDPGLGVLLVPLGAVLLFCAMLSLALGAGTLELREIAFASPEYEQSLGLRTRVLREPLGLRPAPEERDEESRLVHLGVFEGERLIACLMLHDLGERRVRMRQVAVEFERQRSGVGSALVGFSETVARERGFEQMVLAAREAAIPFYERLGYESHGEPFVEVTIPHLMMRKSLRP